MKAIGYIFFGVFSVASFAQEVQRSALGMSGTNSSIELEGQMYYVLSSVGQQGVIGVASDGTFTLRQGYQQPPIRVEAISGSENQLQAAVYPNPVGGIVTIRFGSAISSQILNSLYDIQGREIQTSILAPTQSFEIDMSQLAAGNYILKVLVKEELFTARLIKN